MMHLSRIRSVPFDAIERRYFESSNGTRSSAHTSTSLFTLLVRNCLHISFALTTIAEVLTCMFPYTAFDRKKNILYVNISQIFRIWFVPFYMADVNLTTVLELARIGEPFKEKYYIRSQNDLYQVDQFVKFFLPWGIGVHIVMLWHWFATLCCVAGATFLGLLHWFVVDTVQRIIRTTPSDERHRVIRDALLDRQDCRFEGDDYDIALQQLLESKRTNAIVEQNT